MIVLSAANSGSGSGTITSKYNKAPWVIAVASVDKTGVLAPSSSRGRKDMSSTFPVDV